jgi:hypothetical protein
MDPIQLYVAKKLVLKVKDNLSGLYPPVLKVLLGLIGPYGEREQDRRAFDLLAENFYAQVKSLSSIKLRNGAQLSEFLPTNVYYDFETDALIHTYFGGSTAITFLGDLHPSPLPLQEYPMAELALASGRD